MYSLYHFPISPLVCLLYLPIHRITFPFHPRLSAMPAYPSHHFSIPPSFVCYACLSIASLFHSTLVCLLCLSTSSLFYSPPLVPAMHAYPSRHFSIPFVCYVSPSHHFSIPPSSVCYAYPSHRFSIPPSFPCNVYPSHYFSIPPSFVNFFLSATSTPFIQNIFHELHRANTLYTSVSL